MSHFSDLLSTAVTASGLTQAEVEQRTGIERSALSRLMSGALPPSRINLERLFSKFQPNTMVGHELVFAHLRDEAVAAGIPGGKLKCTLIDDQAETARANLPVHLIVALDLLAVEAGRNVEFAALITDWAAVIRSHHTALERKIYPFPEAQVPRAVAEEQAPNAKKSRLPRPTPAFPRGDSQRPTA